MVITLDFDQMITFQQPRFEPGMDLFFSPPRESQPHALTSTEMYDWGMDEGDNSQHSCPESGLVTFFADLATPDASDL